jgi:hypothetical protein
MGPVRKSEAHRFEKRSLAGVVLSDDDIDTGREPKLG